MTAVEQWAIFFAKANDPECRDAINEIRSRKEGISVAYNMLTSISTDENERARFRSRRMWQMDRDHEKAVHAHEKAELEKAIAEINSQLSEKDSQLSEKDALIARLRAELDGRV